MPVYEYACEDCSKKFEEFVHTSDTVVSCRECGSTKLKKLFSVFGLKLGESGGGGG